MTANQIAFAKLQEDKRHNVVSEKHEHANVQSQRMTAEANKMNASTNWWSAQETGRHNRAAEEETAAHNRESERQNWWKYTNELAESQRHNQETERTARNSANWQHEYWLNQSEAILRQAGASERQADAAQKQAEASAKQAQIAEVNAKTRKDELAASIAAVNKNVGLGYSQLGELNRHQTRTEDISAATNYFGLVETIRHDMATESINSRNADSNRIQAEASKSQAKSSERNARSNERNATSNRIKAVTGGVRDVTSSLLQGFSALRR